LSNREGSPDDGIRGGGIGVAAGNAVCEEREGGGMGIAGGVSGRRSIYVVAAPPQAWNAFGATTNQLVSLYPGQFVGVELVNGSHVDSMLGGNPLVDFAAQLVTQFSPPGNTAAVYTLATGWINDIYTPGAGPATPMYGIYGPTGNYVPPGGQLITLGQAIGIVLP
jgi:hypothetical protein